MLETKEFTLTAATCQMESLRGNTTHASAHQAKLNISLGVDDPLNELKTALDTLERQMTRRPVSLTSFSNIPAPLVSHCVQTISPAPLTSEVLNFASDGDDCKMAQTRSERKRATARKCRLKKKKFYTDMSSRCKVLSAENDLLRQSLYQAFYSTDCPFRHTDIERLCDR
eukprot:CAMPEP_0185840662 /NCGR_PEP_ID=MMETSP1353-20130828/16606_1 /TAXON_ID=1077150 /ORGANISM="Erythrolobus australicus, Strain CCMP3124" /LENGTH=169 /DNA_ID=CAMNT_0028540019 /DNA_START=182 /DNA_END=688 /DNA_ORIENTATION=-